VLVAEATMTLSARLHRSGGAVWIVALRFASVFVLHENASFPFLHENAAYGSLNTGHSKTCSIL